MDLDDLNDNTKDGIHAACMGGAWQAVVFGFGGMRTGNGLLSFSPRLPKTLIIFHLRLNTRDVL